MRMPVAIPAVILLAAATLPGRAAEQPQWKLKDPFFVSVGIKKTTETVGIGPDKVEKKNMDMVFEVTPRAVKGGGFVLGYKFLHVASHALDPAVPVLKKGIGETIDFTLSKDFRLEKVEGIESFLKKAMGKDFDRQDPKIITFMTSVFESVFKVCVYDCYFPLPALKKPTANDSELSVAGMVNMTVKRKIAWKDSPEAGIVNFEFTGDVAISESKDDADLIGVKIKSVKLNKPGEYLGAIRFDTALGRPVEVVVTTEADMSMEMKVMDMEFKSTSKETSKMVFRFSDKKPEWKE